MKTKYLRHLLLICGALLVLGLTSGCSAKARAARHFNRGENYFKASEFDKAKIEYMNAIRADQNNLAAFTRLGEIWLDDGAPLRAGPFLMRACELAPNDHATRLKLARLYLSIGDMPDAFRQAGTVLQKQPTNGEALLVLAESSRTVEELNFVEEALQKFASRDTVYFHLAAATIALRKQDLTTGAKELEAAQQADPKSALPHSGLATFYLVQKNIGQAGQELKAAADLSPLASQERIRYAEFLAATNRIDDAAALLKEINSKAPQYLPAWRLLAQIALSQNRLDDALALADKALAIDSDNPDCRMVEAEARIAKGEGDKAIQSLERLDKTYPTAPMIKLQLARAHLAMNDLPSASAVLTQAIAANPQFTDAVLLLAKVQIQSGELQPAINSMEDLLKKQPHLQGAELLLADAYRAMGRLDDAATIFRAQIASSDQNAGAHLALGLILRQQNKLDEAQAELQRALDLAPSPTTADQLMEVQLARNDPADAMETVKRQLEKTPDSAPIYLTEGKIFATQQQWDKAEEAFSKAAELDPNLTAAYDLLIGVYIATNRLPEAATKLEYVASKVPVNPAALMILGLVYDRMNDSEKARDTYEKLLAIKPDFFPALNNLAYILTDK
ncbi:MAG: tetratricopeptide repeat protein, partial [Verrucomicrobiota bacterium]|nr:tetratricopeptide repeat protein [Verrucomicrobiota bacterium]